MTAYVAVQIDVQDQATYERYKSLAPASIAAFGGRYLVRGGATELLEGGWTPSRFVILEFPTVERARGWWGSAEYAPAKALRQASAGTEMILIEGVQPNMLVRHSPPTISPPVGNYSHSVEVPAGTRLLFISGQVPERPDGVVPEGFEAQCEAVWANVLAALAAAGLQPEHLVKVTTYLTDPSQAEANSRIRQACLGEARPALTVVIARTLDSVWLLEIEAIAAAPGR